MIMKMVKYGVIGLAGAALLGGLLFGADILSYAGTSAKAVRTAMKDNVPIEFELQRARDTLDQVIPEMQANIRLVAQEEVEVNNLNGEIRLCSDSLDTEKVRVAKLRDLLTTERVRYTFAGIEYSRDQVKDELARRFDRFKEAELVLAGKKRLLETRQKSLQAAMKMLDSTRAQKVRLEDQIAMLDSQYRLVKASAAGSGIQIDNSKLAQTERLLGEIKKRLDTTERILAHEARFTQPMDIDVTSEHDLVTQVDDYFKTTPATQPTAEALAARTGD